MQNNNSDDYSGEYESGIRYWIDSFSVFSSSKSSVNCLNTKDKIFSPKFFNFLSIFSRNRFRIQFYVLWLDRGEYKYFMVGELTLQYTYS